MASTMLRNVDIRALRVASRSYYPPSYFSNGRPCVRSIAHTVGKFPVPTVDKGSPVRSLSKKTNDLSFPIRADTRTSRLPQSVPEITQKCLRAQRFEQTMSLLSSRISQGRSMNDSPQVRSSAWLYLFDLATCAQQLERASSKFSQFVDSRRQFRDVHVNAFVRRCVELRCPGLALTVFSDRPAYRMDLTLPAARQLLYAFHEERQLSNVVALAALFPVYNLRALSSDPISCALFVSACLREGNISGSEPASVVAATFLSPFKQLLSQTLPMPLSVESNRFLESRWMKDAMLSILDLLGMQGHETSWVRDWCNRSHYNFLSNI